MVALPKMDLDPTLEEMFKIIEIAESMKPERDYLGASGIGDDCERKLWYQYHKYPRKPKSCKGILAAEDGHRTEDLIATRLRLVRGIELWTLDENGKQFGFSKYDGRFKGHADGVIRGLLQAPKTPHIWENKACNEKIFSAFVKSRDDYGDKHALENWNTTYYGQAQSLMGELQLDRHYLTVSLAGGRDVVSCRTDFVPSKHKALDQKAQRIIAATSEPARISERKEFYKCKICDFADTVCHVS